MVGVSNENVSTIEQFVQDQGLTFPVLRDNSNVYYSYFLSGGISPYPRDFIIDQEGVLRYASTEYDVQTMQSVIQSLLSTTDRHGDDHAPPQQFALQQNYPNPFNSETVIPFRLPENARVTVTVYDIHGRKIRSLDSGNKNQGEYRIRWDGKNNKGRDVSSGVYFVRLATDHTQKSRKMVLIR